MGIIEQMHEIKRQEGVEEGRREGIQKGLESVVQKLLVNTEFSPEEIAKLVEVPVALVKKVKNGLKGK
ncbi:MAG TPA: hypothetical protein VGM30_19645 [Puia sp.]|jgi:predicted transposase YdaD